MEPRQSKVKKQLLEAVLENHLETISSFLRYEEVLQLRQVNRICYYGLIAIDMWNCLKVGIAHLKMEDLDDLDFDSQEPTQQQSRLNRNIRVHSVSKKSLEVPSSGLPVAKLLELPKRFPSHAKKTEPDRRMMSTTMGFKRLGFGRKGGNSYDHLLELPDRLQLSELQIRLNDSISKNIEKAQLVGDLLNRWADYQKKLVETREDCKADTAQWAERATMYKEYHRRFSTEEYAKLLANFDKVVLIDDTVTKRFKLFTERHKTIMEAAPQIDAVVAVYAKVEAADQQLQSIEGFRAFEAAFALVEAYCELFGKTTELLKGHAIGFVEQVVGMLARHISRLSIRSSCMQPSQSELCLQALQAIGDQIIKLLEGVNGRLRQDMELSKWKHIRYVSMQMLKMAKYFGKLRNQVATREQKQGSPAIQIKGFLQLYEKYELELNFFEEKHKAKFEAEIAKFKARIQDLKTKVKQRTVS